MKVRGRPWRRVGPPTASEQRAPCAGAGQRASSCLRTAFSSEGHPFDRPLPQQRRSSSARPSSSASRPSARAATRPKSSSEGSNPASQWRNRRRDGEARWRRDERRRAASVESRSRATVSQAKVRATSAPRGEREAVPELRAVRRQAPFPRAPALPWRQCWRFSARRRRLGHRRRGQAPASTMACRWARWMSPA